MLLSRSVTLSIAAVVVAVLGILVGCGSSREAACSTTALQSDPENCGFCGNACGDGTACIKGACKVAACQPGATEDCYTGVEGTQGVGTCVGGQRTCGEDGLWLACENQVIPVAENCSDAVDNNCNGEVDENADHDEDGFTTCGVPGLIPGDCCDSTECTKPKLVNAGAFDAAGNNLDDNCNGIIDDTLLLCDQGLDSNSTNGLEFAKAIDICQVATEENRSWGVIDAKITLTDGTDIPDKRAYAIRERFGSGVLPQGGVNLAMISTGAAAGIGDVNPDYFDWGQSYTHSGTTTSPYPEDWYMANGNTLPNAPGCTVSNAGAARDPVMYSMRVRVPTNAKSFRLSINFFSTEFPEWTCSSFNDFFVVLLDSTYTGEQPNPTDKNLAFFTTPTMDKVPVGVNLAHGNTGLFTQCVNGPTGCSGMGGSIMTCKGIEQLAGTGLDQVAIGSCAGNDQRIGGGTGWLVTKGNVVPGEIITLRIAVWDTQDWSFDSIAIFDGFAWSTELADPGTVIF